MRFVYQIGRVPLFGALVNDIEMDEGRDWSVKTTEFQQSSGYFTHTQLGRRTFSPVNVSIVGDIDTYKIGFLHTASMLKALGGLRDVPLIVFELGHIPSQNPSVRWLYTTGSITKAEEKSKYGNDVKEFYTKSVSLTMRIDPVWKPLLGSYWESRPVDTRSSIITTRHGFDTMFYLPKDLDEVRKDRYFERWGNTLSQYDPSTWPYMYEKGTGYGTDWDYFKSFYVYSNESQWPAPPSAHYAFTQLLPQGTLSIVVTNSVTTFTSTLDLTSLNTQLNNAGLSGLMASDEIFVGDTAPFPCFIRRNEAILNVTPRWTSQSGYPGELMSGLNKVTISGNNTNGKFAANIEFGSL